MGAEDKWLHFSRCNLQSVFSVKPLPWFHHSCIAWIATCLLCSSACSAGKLLLWRPHVSHPHRALPGSSGQGQTSPVWEWEGPISPLLFLPLAEGALRAALPIWPGGAFSSCPAGKGSSPRRQGPGAPTGLIPVPVCGNTHGTSSLGSSSTAPTRSGTRCNRQGKNFDSSEMGLYGVYCSKHFIILQWDVLRSAKYYC